jgi:hypothetical protein
MLHDGPHLNRLLSGGRHIKRGAEQWPRPARSQRATRED